MGLALSGCSRVTINNTGGPTDTDASNDGMAREILGLNDKPKLVVGIVVDQMRADYIARYWSKYSEKGGFKRMVKGGAWFTNCNFDYYPTYTAPGHASIYTGSIPAINGIVGNDWFDRVGDTMRYVTDDARVLPVGNGGAFSDSKERQSPRILLSTTITDELERFTQGRSKVVGIALKDRGAILPAGHLADGAYWFHDATGQFISSTHYMIELPAWAKAFNNRNIAGQMNGYVWNPVLPLAQYTESTADDVKWEAPLWRNGPRTFPYDLSKAPTPKPNKTYELLRSTPLGLTITTQMAIAALEGEQMGRDSIPDFLAVSYSTTDYVGHKFGPRSVEVEDLYLRLDRELGELLDSLEAKVGENNFVLFLTADHGVVDNVGQLEEDHIANGTYSEDSSMTGPVNRALFKAFKVKNLAHAAVNQQIYLDRALIHDKGLDFDAVAKEAAYAASLQVGVRQARPMKDVMQSSLPTLPNKLYINGMHPKRSGDVLVEYDPQWVDDYSGRKLGTTHGQPYKYDTNVPLIFYGDYVSGRRYSWECSPSDIAQTIAEELGILPPSGSIGVRLELE